jgi:hypothetical protein
MLVAAREESPVEVGVECSVEAHGEQAGGKDWPTKVVACDVEVHGEQAGGKDWPKKVAASILEIHGEQSGGKDQLLKVPECILEIHGEHAGGKDKPLEPPKCDVEIHVGQADGKLAKYNAVIYGELTVGNKMNQELDESGDKSSGTQASGKDWPHDTKECDARVVMEQAGGKIVEREMEQEVALEREKGGATDPGEQEAAWAAGAENVGLVEERKMKMKSKIEKSTAESELKQPGLEGKEEEKLMMINREEEEEKAGNGESEEEKKKTGNGESEEEGKKAGNGESEEEKKAGNGESEEDKKAGNSESEEEEEKAGNGESEEEEEKAGNGESEEDLEEKAGNGESEEEEKAGNGESEEEEDEKAGNGESEEEKKAGNGDSQEEGKAGNGESEEEEKKAGNGESDEEEEKAGNGESDEEEKVRTSDSEEEEWVLVNPDDTDATQLDQPTRELEALVPKLENKTARVEENPDTDVENKEMNDPHPGGKVENAKAGRKIIQFEERSSANAETVRMAWDNQARMWMTTYMEGMGQMPEATGQGWRMDKLGTSAMEDKQGIKINSLIGKAEAPPEAWRPEVSGKPVLQIISSALGKEMISSFLIGVFAS